MRKLSAHTNISSDFSLFLALFARKTKNKYVAGKNKDNGRVFEQLIRARVFFSQHKLTTIYHTSSGSIVAAAVAAADSTAEAEAAALRHNRYTTNQTLVTLWKTMHCVSLQTRDHEYVGSCLTLETNISYALTL